MRRHVIATLEKHDIGVSDATIEWQDLASVDEVFITNSQFGILPLRSCGEISWSVGATTRNVMECVSACGVPECRL